MWRYTGSSPAKIILAGEHAVVHHTRAIATVVERRTVVSVRPCEVTGVVILTFQHTDGRQYQYQWDVDVLRPLVPHYDPSAVTLPPAAVVDELKVSVATLAKAVYVDESPFNESLIVFLLYYILLYRCRSSVEVSVSSAIPLAAGLGSSASFCAASATAFYGLSRYRHSEDAGTHTGSGVVSLTTDDLSLINSWAFEGERLIHGNPSGVDNTCVVYGGVIVYQRKLNNEIVISHLPRLPSNTSLLITHTRQPRDTKKLVEGVRQLKMRLPSVVNPVIESIDQIAAHWIAIVEAQPSSLPMTELASLIKINQSLLAALGVSHSTIENVIAITERHGLVSKLTGAGGGGCVISFISSDDNSNDHGIEAARHELLESGYVCIEGLCGQTGVALTIEQ